MPNYPWFRLYSADLLSDRKLLRISRVCNLPMATVRGVWLTLLAMANDSPERGCLLISTDIPVTEEEIRCDLGLDPATFEALLSEMETLNMIQRGDCIVVTKFLERNPSSDSSTERVRRYRARKRGERQGKAVPETLPERPGNAIDQDQESDQESEGDQDQQQEAAPREPVGKPVDNSPQRPLDDGDDALLSDLIEAGMTDKGARTVVETCDGERVRTWLAYVRDNGRIENPGGYLWHVLTESDEGAPRVRAPPGEHRSKAGRRRYVEGEYGDQILH